MLVRFNFILSLTVFVLILLNYFTDSVQTSPFIITGLVSVVIGLIGVENVRNGLKFQAGSFLFAASLLMLVAILGFAGVIEL
ncbi:hypothetical protein [Alkalibacillus almallahensis]|uniref:hypothetical protein n=1 Tax=Alkalibacillus almallahensis TaxID=1379154 RepID=UPI0014219ED7|nr:hypothetical protein [Alkalibacillus almallahensis]NIK12106.1 hypothetical protein [Alkalibacillus almallahensis]